MIEFPETHQQGFVEIHNQEMVAALNLSDADFGLQVAPDGRVWVCINGIAFIRFKPNPTKYIVRPTFCSGCDSWYDLRVTKAVVFTHFPECGHAIPAQERAELDALCR